MVRLWLATDMVGLGLATVWVRVMVILGLGLATDRVNVSKGLELGLG